mgnify:FL=1
MVIGETRNFFINAKNGAEITSQYSARYQLTLQNTIVLAADVPRNDDDTKFVVNIETADLAAGSYRLDVFVRNSVEGIEHVVHSETISLRV